MKEIVLEEEECNISTILTKARAHSPGNELWFRGQARSPYPLLPSIFRQGSGAPWNKSLDEAAMLREFQRRYPQMRASHSTIEDWLSLMQHYGLPSRILDWTTNLATGLFFATQSMNHDGTSMKDGDDEEDGALFVLDTQALELGARSNSSDLANSWSYSGIRKRLIEAANISDVVCNIISFVEASLAAQNFLNLLGVAFYGEDGERVYISTGELKFLGDRTLPTNTLEKIEALNSMTMNLEMSPSETKEFTLTFMIEKLQQPIELRVSHLNDRIKAQDGVFTIHGGKYIDGIPIIPFLPPEELWGAHLLKLVIPANCKQQLWRELAYLGATKERLFPEMVNVAESITNTYTKTL